MGRNKPRSGPRRGGSSACTTTSTSHLTERESRDISTTETVASTTISSTASPPLSPLDSPPIVIAPPHTGPRRAWPRHGSSVSSSLSIVQGRRSEDLAEIERLNYELAAVSQSESALNARVAYLSRELSEAVSASQRVHVQAEADRVAAAASYQKLLSQLSTARLEMQQVTASLTELSERHCRALDQNEILRNQVSALQEANDRLVEQVDELKHTNARLQTTVDDLSSGTPCITHPLKTVRCIY